MPIRLHSPEFKRTILCLCLSTWNASKEICLGLLWFVPSWFLSCGLFPLLKQETPYLWQKRWRILKFRILYQVKVFVSARQAFFPDNKLRTPSGPCGCSLSQLWNWTMLRWRKRNWSISTEMYRHVLESKLVIVRLKRGLLRWTFEQNRCLVEIILYYSCHVFAGLKALMSLGRVRWKKSTLCHRLWWNVSFKNAKLCLILEHVFC